VDVIKENERRREALQEQYEPETGIGCYGERFLLSLSDSPIGDMYLPIAMQNLKNVRALAGAGSFQARIESLIDSGELNGFNSQLKKDAWVAFCELRMSYDFEYFAFACETIKDKLTGNFIPFVLNKGQRKIFALMENMRMQGRPVRLILLKARQWGGSTLIQMYMLWIQILLKRNWNSVICAHKMDAARNINAMYKICTDEMIPLNGVVHKLTPFEGAHNIKQVEKRGCRITIGSAEAPDSVRSQDVKMVHFSEAAYFPSTEKMSAQQLVASIVSSIPLLPNTMVVYESTANGVLDFFNLEYEKAAKGESTFEAAFVSWFEIGDLYTAKIDDYYYGHNGRLKSGGYAGFVKDMNEYEVNLFTNYKDVTLEHLNWYRQKKSELADSMQQEYPSDAVEAFKDSGSAVFKADHVEALRGGCSMLPVAAGVMAAEGDAATAKISGVSKRAMTRKVQFEEDRDLLEVVRDAYQSRATDEQARVYERKLDSKLIVWRHPDRDIAVKNRYLVIYDPQKGLTDKADWGCITVIDRYWRMYGGKPEVVAEWRGHEDRDIAVWVAVQIAIYYNNALLIVESNTFDSTYSKESGTEFVFETIASCYSNLYSRTEPDKVKENLAVRYGFHMNRNTKPAIMANYIAVLREGAYIEHSHRTLDQARVYERKEDGTYGAKDGYHDDDLMTRMIGLHVDYHELPLPETIESSAANRSLTFTPVNESSL